jgi:hypothetical protein
MHEYVTLSSSSYDPAALASKLTEKSGEGWEVVSIVPTGGDVTAFLRRAAVASEPETEPGDEGAIAPIGADAATDEAAAGADSGDTTGEMPVDEGAPLAAVAATDTFEPESEPEAEAAPAEPAGWAAAPDPTPAATPASDLPAEAAAAAAVAPAGDVVDAPVEEPPAADVAPEPEPAGAESSSVPAPPAPAPAPSVPAGWYSDPSGRFELRYWDGGQWTEHVARGGAQYTDPPVA